MKKLTIFAAAAAVLATAANAEVIFDSGTGSGFVGKGDVQLVYGWNNATLQRRAGDVSFHYESTEITTLGWTCDRDGGPQTQERSRTSTTRIQGVVESIARDSRRQVTGFILSGFEGGAATGATTTEGPAYLSCPAFWTAINPTSETETVPGALTVSIDGGLTKQAFIVPTL